VFGLTEDGLLEEDCVMLSVSGESVSPKLPTEDEDDVSTKTSTLSIRK
jgi:hypothetical protein